MGYAGIQDSLAVTFDTYPNGSTTGVYANGHIDDAAYYFLPFDIADGRTYRVELSYDADIDTLYQVVVPLDEHGVPIELEAYPISHYEAYVGWYTPVPLDVAAIVGGGSAHVGFTAATGGLNSEHRVSNFFFDGDRIEFTAPQAPAAAANLAVGDASGTYGGTTALTATLVDASGQPLADRTVTFRVKGAVVGDAITGVDGVAMLAGVSLAGIEPGAYGGAVTAGFVGDGDNGPAEGAGSLTVSYGVRLGFNDTRRVQRGSVVPVRLSLTDAAGTNVSSASVAVTATRLVSSTGESTTPAGPGGSHAGGLFHYDPLTNSYQFNLQTTGLTAGTYTLYFTADSDTLEHAVQVVIV